MFESDVGITELSNIKKEVRDALKRRDSRRLSASELLHIF